MESLEKTGIARQRRFLTIMGRALAVAAVALGVARADSLAADNPANDGGEVRIIANEAYASTWQTILVPEFNKSFPNVKIRIDGVPYTELLAKMVLDATSPTPEYDVLLADDPWIPQLAEIGALLDLKGEKVAAITGKEYDWEDFNAAPLAAGEWKGVQYAVPVRSNMLLMFYNRALYKKAGVPEPTPDLTWDQFFANAQKLVQDTNGDGKPDAWAVDTYFVRDPLTPTIWQAILNSNGGALFDEAGAPAFANDTGIAALAAHKRLLDYAPPGALGHGFAESLQAFRQGLVANMITWGSVYKATAVDKQTTTLTTADVGVQLMPVGAARAGTHRGIWIAGVSSKTKNLKASWAFVEWLSSRQGERINAAMVGSFPARKSTLAAEPDAEWLKPVYKALQSAYGVSAEGKMWRTRSPKSDAAQQILADEIARALAGQATFEKALKTASDKVARVVR